MSWLNSLNRHRRFLPGATAIALMCILSTGCTSVQPLYGTLPGQSSNVQTRLRQIEVAAVGDRISQVIRNELIFALYGGDGSPDKKPLYRLQIRIAGGNISVGVAKFQSLPSSYLNQLNATFSLIEISTQKTVLTGTSVATAAYDFSNQRFANVRAVRDAENRASTLIADDIHTKLAAFFTDHN